MLALEEKLRKNLHFKQLLNMKPSSSPTFEHASGLLLANGSYFCLAKKFLIKNYLIFKWDAVTP